MGLLSKLKERYNAQSSFSRVSSKNDLGVDIGRKSQEPSYKEGYGGFESTRKYKVAKDEDLFESKEEKRERNRAAIARRMGQIRSGYEKFERGKKGVNKLFKDLGTLVPDQGPAFGGGSSRSRRSRGGGMSGFGISDKDLREMQGLNGGFAGSMFGGSSRRASGHKKAGSKRGLVPIYRGRRVVGYTQGRSKSRRKAKRDPWELDLGF